MAKTLPELNSLRNQKRLGELNFASSMSLHRKLLKKAEARNKK
jgi:hypothetical protein